MKRRQCDKISRGIRQCVEMVKLLVFKPVAYAILIAGLCKMNYNEHLWTVKRF
jgi:hypothetical protein